jgi:UDP-glucose 4-epimerase
MKILVTGGCGFIGSNLVDSLVNAGHDVRVIDNLSADSHEQFYYNNSAEYHNLNVADYDSTLALYQGIECVYHLAADARIQSAIQNPLRAVETNCLGTATVLEASRYHGIDRVIYSSTSSAYGQNPTPFTECMPTDCLNTYSVTKLFGEELCRVYAKMYGLKTIIFRYFNVYGNREPITGPYAPVIGRFLNQRRLGQCLTIVGDGSQRRDFTHVSDVVNANTQASTIQLSEYGQLFNIGTGKNYSIKQIADMISSNQESTCSRIGEASETLADVTKAHQLLEWSARVSLVDYIREKVDD